MSMIGSTPGLAKGLIGISLAAAFAVIAMPAAAVETEKIFRSDMPDGSVVFGDKPAAGAKSVASDTIVLSAPAGSADAERDYWRRQAEAFNRRQAIRDADDQRRHHQPHGQYRDDVAMSEDLYYPVYVGGRVAKPIVSLDKVPRSYQSSPGAVRGRDSGFIGSGFSAAR